MSSDTSISSGTLYQLIGTAKAPTLIDVRIDEEFTADPRLIPGSLRRSHREVQDWAPRLSGKSVVVICHEGQKLSEGTAAWLRQVGVPAKTLEGGHFGWVSSRKPVVSADKIPRRDGQGRSVWVTRERPKIDGIACPWLIRRFIDPEAVFHFVKPSDVQAVADRYAATPFDVENVFWSHRGGLCTFDVMVKEYGLSTPPLERLSMMVRGAETARLALSPEAAGLLAASHGLSSMFGDDRKRLDAGLMFYDAFYRWCRDAADETHNWAVGVAKH